MLLNVSALFLAAEEGFLPLPVSQEMDRVTVKDPPLVHSRAGTRRAGVTVTATARSPERGTRGSGRTGPLRELRRATAAEVEAPNPAPPHRR